MPVQAEQVSWGGPPQREHHAVVGVPSHSISASGARGVRYPFPYMQQDILVNWSPQETRVAIVESGAVQELHVERTLERGLVGNVYLGKVARVLPGMQS